MKVLHADLRGDVEKSFLQRAHLKTSHCAIFTLVRLY